MNVLRVFLVFASHVFFISCNSEPEHCLLVSNQVLNVSGITPDKQTGLVRDVFEYYLSNCGDERINILRVVASCGCADVSYPNVLNPGESSIIVATVEYAPSFLEKKKIEITLDVEGREAYSVSLFLNLSPGSEYHLSPKFFDFRNVSVGDSLTKKIKLKAKVENASDLEEVDFIVPHSKDYNLNFSLDSRIIQDYRDGHLGELWSLVELNYLVEFIALKPSGFNQHYIEVSTAEVEDTMSFVLQYNIGE